MGERNPYTNCWSYTYDRTSLIHLMADLCVAAELCGLIKKKEIRKRGNCECVATWGHPSHANPLPLYLRRHAKVVVAEPIHCRIIAFLLLIHYFTPWPWPFTLCAGTSLFWLWPLTINLEHLMGIFCDVMKLSTKLECNRTIRSYRDFSVWSYDFEHVLGVALGSGIIFTKFDLRGTYPCLNYSVFWCLYVMSNCDLDLVTLKVHGTPSVTWS